MSQAGAETGGEPHHQAEAPPIVLFGLRLRNWSMAQAVAQLSAELADRDARCVYFVNAHAATLAGSDAGYKAVLARADHLLIDGIGVRMAAWLRGARPRANLVGTDLVPALLRTEAGVDRSYFMLGGTEAVNAAAAGYAGRHFPAWRLAGRRQGYLNAAETEAVIAAIAAASPDVLLVAMGNPLQEAWLDRHRARLRVGVGLAVGGLFDHWAGGLRRAPGWVRRWGLEWVQLTLQQPRRAGRYVHDIPVFLWRALRARRADRAAQGED